MSVVYSQQVPTVPGWYWRRDKQGEMIMQLPYCGRWPTPWTTQRDETLAVASSQVEAGHYTQESISPLLNQPDSFWIVEWAGPIPQPGEVDLIDLLERCHPFLVHALCSIPDDNPEYAKAMALAQEVNAIAFPEVRAAFKKDKERQEKKS